MAKLIKLRKLILWLNYFKVNFYNLFKNNIRDIGIVYFSYGLSKLIILNKLYLTL